MDRNIWESIVGFVSLQNYPALPCPYCMTRSLTIDQASISYSKPIRPETSAVLTRKMDSERQEISEPYNSKTFVGVLAQIFTTISNLQKRYVKFVCFLKCQRCGEVVSATGTGICQLPSGAQDYSSTENPLLKVEYFSPPIPIFNVSSKVPRPVREEVLQSFNHFHCDLPSSGAKLRRSMEKLCVELGIKEKTLHNSLTAMEKSFPKEAGLLQSLKLLGNEATHADSVTEEDLLDAFEVQEFVLEMFDRIETEKQIEDKANKLRARFDRAV